MDWRERLKACQTARLRPAYGDGGCATWLDGWERTIVIDWQAERFTYHCPEIERPAAFSPGKSYPLELLVAALAADLEPPASDRPLYCAACGLAPAVACQPCSRCGCRDVSLRPIVQTSSQAPIKTCQEPKQSRKTKAPSDGLKQLSLF